MSAIASILVTRNAQFTNASTLLRTTSATVGSDSTLTPAGPIAPGVNRWADRSIDQAVNQPSYEFSFRNPLQNQRNFRLKEVVRVPVANITAPSTGSGIQPLPSKAFDMLCIREWIIPEAALLADRKLLWGYAMSTHVDYIIASDDAPSGLTGSIIREAVINYEQPYGY